MQTNWVACYEAPRQFCWSSAHTTQQQAGCIHTTSARQALEVVGLFAAFLNTTS